MASVGSVAMGFLLPAGSCYEAPPVPAGVSQMVASLVLQGTLHRDARALTEAFEEIGARRDVSVEPEYTWLGAVVLARHLPAALELLVDMARYPSFPADELPKVRGRLLQSIAQQEDEPSRKVFALLREAAFGDHPLGRPLLGTAESVAAIDEAALRSYWAARYGAGAAILAVAGRIDLDALWPLVDGLCGDWPAGPARQPLPPAEVRRSFRAARTESSQQHIALAMPGLPAGHDDAYVAAVLGMIYGGSMNSRLFTEVREKRGLAYSVSASHVSAENSGTYRVYAGTTPERAHESLTVIVDEARRLAAQGITAEELARAKVKLKSSVVMAGESTALRRRALGAGWWYEGKVRTLDEVRQRIDAVEVEQVGALARALDLGGTVAVATVGPRDDLDVGGHDGRL
jgi:predicted Zn-dependent peptidase